MSNDELNQCQAVIYGIVGTTLSREEKALFRDVNPYGYILFQRNCESPEQIKALIDSLKALHSRHFLPILIDQEGGRVARLTSPHWRQAPPARHFLNTQPDRQKATRAVYLNARLMADDLYQLGITVDCAPLLDVPAKGSHEIIGDRAFSDNPDDVATLGRAMAEGLLDGGVLPVIKHLPGHGRAGVDSHEGLPEVNAPLDEMQRIDFRPFQALHTMPYGMTAHILYTDLDKRRISTFSPRVIGTIREVIGFDGLLMSDDLSMKALNGDYVQRTRQSIAAGCDVVLHCNGKMEEMKAIASAVQALSQEAQRRALRAEEQWHPPRKILDRESTQEEMARLLDVSSMKSYA